MDGIEKLNAARKRLYAPKKKYYVESPKKVKKVRLESDQPEFKVYPDNGRASVAKKAETVGQLNDLTQVKQKPEISRKADNIVKSRQEQAFKWLYSHITLGEATAGGSLTYDTLKWDCLPTGILECIMPLLVQLLDDEKLAVREDKFLEQLSSPTVVPVFNKAPLLKHIEALREQEKKAEQISKEKRLPWSSSTRQQLLTKNKYRRNFDDFKVEMSLVPTADKTPVNADASHQLTKTRAKLLNALKQRPNTMLFPGRNTRAASNFYNPDISVLSPTSTMAQSTQAINKLSPRDTLLKTISQKSAATMTTAGSKDKKVAGVKAQESPKANFVICSPTRHQAGSKGFSSRSLQSTQLIKTMRLKQSASSGTKPKFRVRPSAAI